MIDTHWLYDAIIYFCVSNFLIHQIVINIFRIHGNDLENIPLFLILGLLYVLTNPVPSTAILVFRIFCGARVLHTIAYFFALAGPLRGFPFLAGLFCNIFLAANIVCTTKFAY